jgi:hypothetical protein
MWNGQSEQLSKTIFIYKTKLQVIEYQFLLYVNSF